MIFLPLSVHQSVIAVYHLQEIFLKLLKHYLHLILTKMILVMAHDHDNIFITMLKICDSVITEPLSIIFKNCIDCGVFADTGKCLILYQPIKRMINALLIIIAQCLFYLFFMFFFIS